MLECATCGSKCEPLNLVHGDGVCAICGSAALVQDTKPEPVNA